MAVISARKSVEGGGQSVLHQLNQRTAVVQTSLLTTVLMYWSASLNIALHLRVDKRCIGQGILNHMVIGLWQMSKAGLMLELTFAALSHT